jgi:hypothetical protein
MRKKAAKPPRTREHTARLKSRDPVSIEPGYNPQISDAAFLQWKQVIEAGGLPAHRSAAEHLAAIAQYTIDMAENRTMPKRERPKLRKRRRRPEDPPNEKLIKRRGAPGNVAMRQLVGGLVGFWLEYAGDIPGVSFREGRGYSGLFLEFTLSFCKLLASQLEMVGEYPELACDLRSVYRNPVRVRTWLRALKVPQFRLKFQDPGASTAFSQRAEQSQSPFQAWICRPSPRKK